MDSENPFIAPENNSLVNEFTTLSVINWSLLFSILETDNLISFDSFAGVANSFLWRDKTKFTNNPRAYWSENLHKSQQTPKNPA